MDEKGAEHAQPEEPEEPHGNRPPTTSSTQVDEQPTAPHHDSERRSQHESLGRDTEKGQTTDDDSSDEDAINHGEPDIDHDEIEAVAPGHEFDVELAKSHDALSLGRAETRGSVRSKLSRVLTAVSRKSRKDGLRMDPVPVSNLDEGIVGWEGQDDPDLPLNFTRGRKNLILGLLSAITFITPFTSSILSPGINDLMTEFHNSNTIIGSLTVSIYLLGYTIGPLFLAPLSELYGRKVVLSVANVFYCCWQIGCALAPDIASLIVFRLFAGIGGAACLTLGGGVIGDIFRADERGFAMGIWTVGPLLGPTLGPLIGGFVAQNVGWRWDFWICLIAGAILTALLQLFSQETNPRVLIHRKVQRLSKELGRDDLRSCYGGAGESMSRTKVLLNGLVRPTKLLFLSPLVFFLSLYLAFVYGVLYLLFTTIPLVFEETYGFSVGITGLVYLSIGLGNIIGWALITAYSDKSVVRLAKANNGVFEPEMRLATTIFFGFFLPITFFWYGWCAEYKTHWIAPILSFIPFGFGIMGLFLPINTYLVDSYPMYAASAIAANTVLRSLVGALLPLAGPTMYDSLGLGWGNSLLGFLCVAMIPVPALIYKYGGKLRKAQRFKL